MSPTIWIIIGVIFIVVWVWIGWEIYNAPMMPDDYQINLKEEDFSTGEGEFFNPDTTNKKQNNN
tara:strand:+ start:184 stop:375 length:192 start_codon:yes stop_codon:yes gene_type:complete